MVTFGAPMILHASDEGALYAALDALGSAAQPTSIQLDVQTVCCNKAAPVQVVAWSPLGRP